MVPQVYEDEPWQASTGYKLLISAVFGSDLFAGFHHMDQRYYGFMPLHPILLAGFFRAFGLGLLQARLCLLQFGLRQLPVRLGGFDLRLCFFLRRLRPPPILNPRLLCARVVCCFPICPARPPRRTRSVLLYYLQPLVIFS